MLSELLYVDWQVVADDHCDILFLQFLLYPIVLLLPRFTWGFSFTFHKVGIYGDHMLKIHVIVFCFSVTQDKNTYSSNVTLHFLLGNNDK